MKFRLLLFILAWRMRWLAWRNPEFRDKIAKKDLVMQWRTHAGSPARWFHFNQGRVHSAGGLHDNPKVTLSFESSDYAYRTILASGRNQMIFMEGMQKGHIKIHGDASQLMWFMTLMKYITPTKKKKK